MSNLVPIFIFPIINAAGTLTSRQQFILSVVIKAEHQWLGQKGKLIQPEHCELFVWHICQSFGKIEWMTL